MPGGGHQRRRSDPAVTSEWLAGRIGQAAGAGTAANENEPARRPARAMLVALALAALVAGAAALLSLV